MEFQSNLPIVYVYPTIHQLLRPTRDRGLRTWDPLEGVGLLTLDIENILAPFGGERPYGDDRVLNIAETIAARGINSCLVSNAKDPERVAGIADTLKLPFLHKSMTLEDGTVMRSKMHPDMYARAVDLVGFGRNGTRAAHVDDQVKNVWGMRRVSEFDRFFWVFPKGMFKSHVGSLAFRAVELPILVPALHILSHDDNM